MLKTKIPYQIRQLTKRGRVIICPRKGTIVFQQIYDLLQSK